MTKFLLIMLIIIACGLQGFVNSAPKKRKTEARGKQKLIKPTSQRIEAKCEQVPSPDQIRDGRFIWVDAEMTGLDVNADHIIEIACVITEANLDVVDTLESIVIHYSEDVFSKMDEWCTKTHKESGLIAQSLASKISAEDADNMLTSFVEKYTNPGKCCLAGNTVYMDANFIGKEFPKFKNHLHYRLIDVSSVKELFKRWNYNKYNAMPPKKLAHRALDDIKESIEELRFYKQNFFITTENEKRLKMDV